MIRIMVPGRPVPAVRMTQRGKYVKPQAQRYLQYKEMVGWVGRHEIKEPLQGDIAVSMRFFLHGGQTPDIDNLIKAILDGLNKVAWNDDKQVTKVTAERGYAENKNYECVEIGISEIAQKRFLEGRR